MVFLMLAQSVVLRVVLGLPSLILLPGYAATAALFAGRDDLNWLERLGYSFALSISLISLIGFLLNYSPWGIALAPLSICLASVTVISCIAAYRQRQKRAPGKHFVTNIEIKMDRWRKPGQIDRLLQSTLVISIVATVAIVIYAIAAPGPTDAFTEFYLLGPDHELGGHPGQVTAGSPTTVILRIVNHEHADLRYRVEWESHQGSEAIATPQLSHGEIWERPFTFSLRSPGEDQPVTFMLYKQNDEEPYRLLHLWITVTEDS